MSSEIDHYYLYVGDIVDFERDWTEFLASPPGTSADTIASSTWAVSGGATGVTIGNTPFTATKTQVWVTVLTGSEGKIFDLVNTVISAGGRKKSDRIRIEVS